MRGIRFGFCWGLGIVLLDLLFIDLEPNVFGFDLGLGFGCFPTLSPGNTQFVEKHSWLLVHDSPLFLLPKRELDLRAPSVLFWACLSFGNGLFGLLLGGFTCLLWRFNLDLELTFSEFGVSLVFSNCLALVLEIFRPIWIVSLNLMNLIEIVRMYTLNYVYSN